MHRDDHEDATARRHAAPTEDATPGVREDKIRSARKAIRHETAYVDRAIDRTVDRILAELEVDRRP